MWDTKYDEFCGKCCIDFGLNEIEIKRAIFCFCSTENWLANLHATSCTLGYKCAFPQIKDVYTKGK